MISNKLRLPVDFDVLATVDYAVGVELLEPQVAAVAVEDSGSCWIAEGNLTMLVEVVAAFFEIMRRYE